MLKRIDYLFVLSSQKFVEALTQLGKRHAFSFKVIGAPEEAQEALNYDQYAAVWVEIDDEYPFGLQLFEWLKTQNLQSQTGIIFTKNYEKSVKRAVSMGVSHFLNKKTFESEAEMLRRLQKSKTDFERAQSESVIRFGQANGLDFMDWVCASSSQKQWINTVIQAFLNDDLLMILGPKGSGKSYLANCLTYKGQHQHLWNWNCEFTPPYEQKDLFLKSFQNANNGDDCLLVIDEVGELDLELQELVVEILQGQGVLSGDQRIWPKVKVVLTSTISMGELVEEGKMRDDLFAMCRTAEFEIQPLTKRPNDVPGLVNSFLWQYSKGKKRVNQDVIDVLKTYDWPSEVRELKHLVENLCQNVDHDIIEPQDLPEDLLVKNFYSSIDDEDAIWELPYQEAKKRALHKFNKAYMKHLLDEAHQNYTVAAEKAGMDRSNFKKLLKKV